MKLVSRRVANFALAASLTFVIGVLPCSAWMIGSQSGHECCDHSSKHSSDPKTTCELLCAISGSPFTVAQKQGVQKTEVSAVLLAAGAASWPLLGEASAAVCLPIRPPDNHPPLYVLHAAFLI